MNLIAIVMLVLTLITVIAFAVAAMAVGIFTIISEELESRRWRK